MKPELGKWTFIFRSYRDIARFERGWRIFEFSIFKPTSRPPEGCRLNKENYQGFRIVFAYWLPIEAV